MYFALDGIFISIKEPVSPNLTNNFNVLLDLVAIFPTLRHGIYKNKIKVIVALN